MEDVEDLSSSDADGGIKIVRSQAEARNSVLEAKVAALEQDKADLLDELRSLLNNRGDDNGGDDGDEGDSKIVIDKMSLARRINKYEQ